MRVINKNLLEIATNYTDNNSNTVKDGIFVQKGCMVATDGKSLIKCPIENIPAVDKNGEPIEETDNNEEYVISKDSAKKAIKNVEKHFDNFKFNGKTEKNYSIIAEGHDTDTEVKGKNIPGNYLEYEHIIPDHSKFFKIKIPLSGIELEKIIKVAKKSDSMAQQVNFTIFLDPKTHETKRMPLEYTISVQGQEVYGLMMPILDEDDSKADNSDCQEKYHCPECEARTKRD